MRKVLHVGSGLQSLPEWLGACSETRLDADESVKPDIVADMTDMGEIGSYDMVYCSHALEHLPPDSVMKALSEFRRVLKDGGIVVVIVPDLEEVKPTFEVVYQSAVGPITGHDMYYGHTEMAKTNRFMRHLTGFVQSTLGAAMTGAGFREVTAKRLSEYNLLGAAIK